MKAGPFLTITLSSAITLTLALAGWLAFAEDDLRTGLLRDAPAIQKLGKPSVKSDWQWVYAPTSDGSQTVLGWSADGSLGRVETRFDPPRGLDQAIPQSARLEDHPLEARGSDAASPYRFLGQPESGRVWKVLPDGRVAALLEVHPWKSSLRREPARALLEKGTLAPALVKRSTGSSSDAP